MLACLDKRGELLRLYWPHIDHTQLIDYFRTGMELYEGNRLTWIDRAGEFNQSYVEDTNIVNTEITLPHGVRIRQRDLIKWDENIYVRNILLENLNTKTGVSPVLVFCQSLMSDGKNRAGALFDEKTDTMVLYRHGIYLAVAADLDIHKYQTGISPEGVISSGLLKGYDRIGMGMGGAFSIKVGDIDCNGRAGVTLYLCPARTLNGALEKAEAAKAFNWQSIYGETGDYWHNHVSKGKIPVQVKEEAQKIYKRSLLTFALLSDKNTGGIIAAPEVDEGFQKCGGYGYCWTRDGVFIAGALDRCGLSRLSRKFYYWVKGVQDRWGMWHQRYHCDMNLAPSWGMQIDETGSVLHGILEHYKIAPDKEFLKDMWPAIEKGARFLMEFTDKDMGLPGLSHDIWEERLGRHAYSCAAVYGGLMAAAESALILEAEGDEWKGWKKRALSIKEMTLKRFYKADYNRFIRSIDVKLNPWGEEAGEDKIFLPVNNKGDVRDFTREDWLVDVSLLGLSVPFNMLDVNDERMVGTARLIEQELKCENTGGIYRYQYDNYMGGNPWIIATCWLALYEIKRGNRDSGLEYFERVLNWSTEQGLLPEQIDKNTGRPSWVIPLTWSHAMFVLLYFELFDSHDRSGRLP